MTWWLSASESELAAASTCGGCGCGEADIDLGQCFRCFSRLPQSEQWRRNAAVARRYRQWDKAATYEARASYFATCEARERGESEDA